MTFGENYFLVGNKHYWDEILNADSNTFEVINKVFSKDKNNIYVTKGELYSIEKLEWADVKTFKVSNDFYRWRDKNNCYVYDEISWCK